MGMAEGYVTLRLFHAEVLGKYRNSEKFLNPHVAAKIPSLRSPFN